MKRRDFIFSFFILSGILTSCTVSHKNNTHLLKIRGWNISSDNLELGDKAIMKSTEYNVNHLQISHKAVHFLTELEDEGKRTLCNHFIDLAHSQGIKEVIAWDHTLYNLNYYPDKFKTGPNGTIDLDNPEFWLWFKQDYRRLLDYIPNIDGIALTFIETGARIERQYSKIYKTDAQKLAMIVDTIASIVINERVLSLYARTFYYSHKERKTNVRAVNLITNPGVIIMVKVVPVDFLLYHPAQNWFGELKHKVIIEFDNNEFNGQGIIANTFPEYYGKMLKHYMKFSNVIGYVIRIDRYNTASAIGHPQEINPFALKSVEKDTSVTYDQIYDSFISQNYGEKVIPFLKPAFKRSFEIIRSTFYTLGIHDNTHSGFDFDHPTNFGRLVAGKWIDPPLVFIGHGVNKKYHFFKDVVNHIAHPDFKDTTAVSFVEDPDFFDNNWLDQREMIDSVYFKDILTEKAYGVRLSEDALRDVVKAKGLMDSTLFEDVYHVFDRTKITANLYYHGARVYYGTRLLLRGKQYWNRGLDSEISEGLEGLLHYATIIENYPYDTPVGQWNWFEDAVNVRKLYNASLKQLKAAFPDKFENYK